MRRACRLVVLETFIAFAAVGGVLVIDDENFRVASKSGTKITVERGYDSTTATNHVLGADVKLITAADADLIEFGDNFGFDGF